MKLGDTTGMRRRRAAIALSAAFVVGAATLAVPAYAQPDTSKRVTAQAEEACPAAVPRDEIVPGMVGEAWTVVRGTTPKPFKVEVLGLVKNGLGTGRDMIAVEVSDLPAQSVVADHGIWAGMSGSPVYVGGKLLGSVSWGYTDAPSPIGGVTPAYDIYDVLNSPTAGQSAAKVAPRTKVTFSASQLKTLNARATAAVPRSLQPVPTPISVSGLSSKRLASLQKAYDKAGRSAVLYAGGSASKAVKAAATAPEPGGNFAAALSYGSVTAAGVGTTTAVCGDKVLAFGHAMLFSGKTTLGASTATSLAIVKNGSYSSFKEAVVDDAFGTVDQDRWAAIRATAGAMPVTTPITSTITNLDNNKTNVSTTDVVFPDYIPTASVLEPWGNYDSTFDKWGKGLTTTSWTVKGTRAGGKAFSLSRSNVWSDLGDATAEPPFELADALSSLQSNEYEPVKITSVDFKSSVKSAYQQYRITKVAVSVNGGKYKNVSSITVKPKAKLKVRVTMRGYQSSVDRNVVLNLTVAKKYAKQTGVLEVQGGLSAGDSSFDDDDLSCLLADCSQPEGSLNSIISDIKAQPVNNAVQADLDFGDRADGKPSTTAKTSAAAPVSGDKLIMVKVKKK